MRFASFTPALAVLTLALAACGPSGAPPEAASQTEAEARPAASAADGYLSPPNLGAAQRTPGGLVLQGHAPAGAQVNLASPEGMHRSAMAGSDGRWTMTLPSPASPAMFAMFAAVGARTLRAEGAVLALPEPGPPALMVRAGFAALPLGAPAATPMITAVDYDRGGGAAAAGMARPMARVRLSVDGVAAGIGQADELGRFAVLATNRPLTPGRRRLQVETDQGQVEVGIEVSQPEPLGRAVYRAERQDGGWRIDWSPAGGGIQTTVVFDRAEAPPPRPVS